MQIAFTHQQFAAQQRAIWDFVFDLVLRLSADIERGAFDSNADGQARREAEELLGEMSNFYTDLLD
jgi:hypothetical protein